MEVSKKLIVTLGMKKKNQDNIQHGFNHLSNKVYFHVYLY